MLRFNDGVNIDTRFDLTDLDIYIIDEEGENNIEVINENWEGTD